MNTEQSYIMHKIVGLPFGVPCASLGCVTPEQLIVLDETFGKQILSSKVSFRYDDEPHDISFTFRRNQQLDALAMLYYPILSEFKRRHFYVSSYFAGQHNDQHNPPETRGQLMFVVNNPLSHRLTSWDSSGTNHSCIPKRGEIMFLDTWCDHAVFPNTLFDREQWIDNPFTFCAVVCSPAEIK